MLLEQERRQAFPQFYSLIFFLIRRCNRQHSGDPGGDDEPPDAQHDERADPEPGPGRPPLHRLLCPLHRHRLLPGQVAVRADMVSGEWEEKTVDSPTQNF